MRRNGWHHDLAKPGLLAAFVLVPSLGIVQKYFRTRGAVLYAAAGFLAILVAHRRSTTLCGLLKALDRKWTWLLVTTLLASLILAFAVLYPMSNSAGPSWRSAAGIAGGGSDRDEALNLGVTELLHGRYPYYMRTQLGNPVSQMPGSLLVAVPFVLLGNAAWQNLFWCAAYFVVARSVLGDTRWALALALPLLAACPIILQDIVTGGDLLANSVVVLFAILLLLEVAQSSARPRDLWLASALVGLSLSSRVTFLLLVPLLNQELIRRIGLRRAAACLVVAGCVFVAITLPFYLYDPTGFAPMAVQNKFAQFGDYAPARVVLLPTLCVACSVLVTAWPGSRDSAAWLVRAALILLIPAALLVALVSIRGEGILFRYCAYALPAALFGALGVMAESVRCASLISPAPITSVPRRGGPSPGSR
jgi:hypothetical protein